MVLSMAFLGSGQPRRSGGSHLRFRAAGFSPKAKAEDFEQRRLGGLPGTLRRISPRMPAVIA
jgi:hypothetical protein